MTYQQENDALVTSIGKNKLVQESKTLVCQRCGYNKFIKRGIMSCSAVPPLFSCAKCNKFTRVPVSYEGNLLVNEGFVNNKNEWYLHVECGVCGGLPSSDNPAPFKQESYTMYDPENNPMSRKKLNCPVCSIAQSDTEEAKTK